MLNPCKSHTIPARYSLPPDHESPDGATCALHHAGIAKASGPGRHCIVADSDCDVATCGCVCVCHTR